MSLILRLFCLDRCLPLPRLCAPSVNEGTILFCGTGPTELGTSKGWYCWYIDIASSTSWSMAILTRISKGSFINTLYAYAFDYLFVIVHTTVPSYKCLCIMCIPNKVVKFQHNTYNSSFVGIRGCCRIEKSLHCLFSD